MDGLDPVVTLELVVGSVDAHVQRVRLSLERARRHQRHGDGSGSCIHGEPRRNRDARVDVFQHLSEEVVGAGVPTLHALALDDVPQGNRPVGILGEDVEPIRGLLVLHDGRRGLDSRARLLVNRIDVSAGMTAPFAPPRVAHARRRPARGELWGHRHRRILVRAACTVTVSPAASRPGGVHVFIVAPVHVRGPPVDTRTHSRRPEPRALVTAVIGRKR